MEQVRKRVRDGKRNRKRERVKGVRKEEGWREGKKESERKWDREIGAEIEREGEGRHRISAKTSFKAIKALLGQCPKTGLFGTLIILKKLSVIVKMV